MAQIQHFTMKLTRFMTICSLRPELLEPKGGRKTQVPLYDNLLLVFRHIRKTYTW